MILYTTVGSSLVFVEAGTTDHTKFVIECGALPRFVELLNSVNDEIRAQVALFLTFFS